MSQKFKSFSDFYPYYLSEHQDKICRRLHFIGSFLILLVTAFAIITQQWAFLWLLPLFGYGFAWTGHFFFEHNRPATFKHPLYSLFGDWVMFKDILFGRIKF
ncbi:MAG: hypothetical protein ACI88A_004326 [Paraglaciecola sp.]|jgi:hypothetical protein